MANKLVVIINNLKVPKIKKILLYEMKFLVPNYSCLHNPWLGSYRPQIPVLSVVCPQLNLLNPPSRTKFLGRPLFITLWTVCFFKDAVSSWDYITWVIEERINSWSKLWWNDTGWRKPKDSEKTLPHCQCVYHKFHMDWPEIEPGSSRWGVRRLTAWVRDTAPWT